MAQGDGDRCIRNAIYRLTFPMKNTGLTLVTGIAGSMAATISKDGGTPSAVSATPAEIGTAGIYTLDLTAVEMTADEIAIKATHGSTIDFTQILQPEPALDSGVVAGVTSSTMTLRSAAVATDDFYNSAVVEVVRGTGAGQVRTITDYVGSTKVATLDRAWITNPDTSSVYLIHPRVGQKLDTSIRPKANIEAISDDSTAADNLEALYEGSFLTGSISDATPSTTSFDLSSGFSATDDFYNDMLVVMTSGACAGIARRVSDYVGSTKTLTVGQAFPTSPANGDTLMLISFVP